jgi:hypothetical protein
LNRREGKSRGLPFSPEPPWQAPFFNKGLFREDFMSIRTVPAILAAAMLVAISFPANAQQKPQPAQSLRLYVLDCGTITPPDVDNYGLKPNEVADTRMVTPCFLIVHPRGT